VGDLCDLVRINSEKGEAKPGAPFGEGPAAAVEAAAKKARDMGFETEVYSGKGYALAYSGAGGKTIGFFAHCDVVPAGPGWTVTAPYEPLLKNGVLFGRGSGDNKTGVVASLWVMKAVRELGLDVKARLMTFMGGDEESGMEDAIAFAAGQPAPALCLVPDCGFPVCNGEKGIHEGVFRCKTAFKEIIGIDGGLAANVIIGEADAKIRHTVTTSSRRMP
jgi:succinyl-diaminopimelate desuccinylase